MLNVLINAYAVSPAWGSEPGMGWNWIINIAKHSNVFVITEGEWKDEILEAVEKLPQKENIHFYFNPVSNKVRKICWNQGDWRFYWYYRKWQKQTLEIAKNIIANNKIDVMHQLNMIGFREPGYLWKIKGIPLVWGPVGGMSNEAKGFRIGMSFKRRFLSSLKTFISDNQIKYHPRVRKMVSQSFMFGAVKSVQDKIYRVYGKNIPLINETGTYLNTTNTSKPLKQSDRFEILWAGRLIPTKRLDIAINTIAQAKNPKIRLTICGVGNLEETTKYKAQIAKLGIERQINWLGKVQHDKMADLMGNSDLFFMTSVADATSTVIVEAITAELPILSFNACGFGLLVNDFAGETIELSNPRQAAIDFAKKINYFVDHPERLKKISDQQKTNKYKLSWDYKSEKILKIYQSVIQNNTN